MNHGSSNSLLRAAKTHLAQGRSRSRWLAIVAMVLALPSASAQTPDGPVVADTRSSQAPNDPPGEWHRAARSYSGTRFSELSEVNAGNVSRLRIAWTFSDGTVNGHEAAPLVVDNTMYLVTPFPNIAYALDLTKPGAPIKWSTNPHPKPVAIGKACCDIVNRGAAYANGVIVYNLLDMNTIALDAKTGRELWRTRLGDPKLGETMTMAPLVVGNKVFVGNSGGEMGVRGWIAALDIHSGKVLWRAYSTGSDADVKIGSDFKPFYSWMRGKDLGITSWPKDAWKQGAGGVWAWVTYDPETNLLYYGTSNPGPRVPAQRPGYNLWTSAVFARDADTGEAKWAYQFTPHDQWDYDGVNENLLIDMKIEGKMRKTLVHFDRNAYAYTIDRLTGEVLVAKQFTTQNWSKGIDLKSGMPIVNPEMEPRPGVKLEHVCPPDLGGKDWQPSAYSPKTGLVYAGIFNLCMDLTDHEQSYIPGTPYDGMEMKRYPAGTDKKWGEFMAWDAVNGKKAWSIKEKFMPMSGALATAGDLVFYGTTDGWFRAVNAHSGKVLWSQRLGSGIIGQPISYRGPDGHQYIAIYAGVGGVAMVQSTEKYFPARGSTLYVFSIDGNSAQAGAGILESPDSPDQSNAGH
jgi:PQQ-dependent dehydrogenase (methanol/ethanol family)